MPVTVRRVRASLLRRLVDFEVGRRPAYGKRFAVANVTACNQHSHLEECKDFHLPSPKAKKLGNVLEA